MGIFRLATWRRSSRSVQEEFLYGFPLGIISLCAASAIALVHPLGRIAAPVLLLATLAPLASPVQPSFKIKLRRALRVALSILPFAAAFGTFMALLWHGPTSTLAARPLADMVYYAGILDTFRHNFLPLPNLAVLGDSISLSNTVPSMIGAAVSLYIDIDPFLFLAGWGASFYVLTFGLSLYMVAYPVVAPARIIACALAFMLGSLYDPSWMINSIPASITFPLFFLSWYMWNRKNRGLNRIFGDSFLLTIGSALGKVTAIFPLVLLAASPKDIRHLRKLYSEMNFASILLASMMFFYSAYMLWRFGPIVWFYFVSAPIGPFTFQNFSSLSNLFMKTNLGFLSRDVGSVALVLAAAFCMRGSLRVMIVACVGLFLIFPLFFTTALLGSVVVSGISILRDKEIYRRCPPLFVISSSLLLFSTLVVDPGEFQMSVAWLICMGGACFIAVARPSRLVKIVPFVGCSIFIAAIALINAGVWPMRTGDSRPYASDTWLTPEFRDIWLAARDRTPKDSLIFTDSTGTVVDLQAGANFYAVFSQRQSYVAGLLNSALYVHVQERSERLARNQDVLDGRISPADLPDAKSYRNYYAIVKHTASNPPGSTLLYENKDFKLLELR